MKVLHSSKGLKKIIKIKIKFGGDLGHLYAGSIKHGGVDKLGRGRGRRQKGVEERKGAHNRDRLPKRQQKKLIQRIETNGSPPRKQNCYHWWWLSGLLPGWLCVLERRMLWGKSG